MPTSHITIHIKKMPKWSTMCVHDVAGISAIYHPLCEGAYFIAKRLQDESSSVLQTSQMLNVKFRVCIAIHYPHS
jgi:hypothetical protein